MSDPKKSRPKKQQPPNQNPWDQQGPDLVDWLLAGNLPDQPLQLSPEQQRELEGELVRRLEEELVEKNLESDEAMKENPISQMLSPLRLPTP
jgi:hypothetical protein